MKTPILFAKICTALGVFFSISLCISYFFLASPPDEFFQPIMVTIERGQGVLSVSKELQKAGVVKSAKVTANLITYLGGEKKIQAGVYLFKEPESVFVVAKKIVLGNFGYTPVRITVPEGSNYKQLARIIHAKFESMATSTLEVELKPLEGYLFPDTYFFPPMATPADIIAKMSDTFKRKILQLQDRVTASGRSLSETIILASILEEEVRTPEDRRIVADLLLRRIQNGMALQVDATLAYINSKSSAELTIKDLKEDNPYNTYTRKGLPPTPISNPGLDTIEAVLEPTPNQYLFYLSDKDGITHFSKTHDEHIKAKKLYLR